MAEKILVISRQIFFDLIKDGMQDFANKNSDYKIDFYCLDYGKYKLKGLNLLKYKFDINNFRKKYYDLERKQLCQIIKNYDQIIFGSLFWDKEYFIQGDFLEALKNKKCKLFMTDSISSINQDINFLDIFDKVFSFEYKDIEYAYNNFGIKIEHLPASTNYYLYDDFNFSIDNGNIMAYDICFICSATKKRLEYLDKIAEWCYKNNKSLFIAGRFWHTNNWLNYNIGKLKFKMRHPVLSKYVQNKFIEPKYLSNIYRKTKICLDINVEYHKSLNRRAYDIMYCGSLLLCDEQDLYNTDILPNIDFVMAKDINDMLKKIEYYLNNDTQRLQIASNGENITKRNHLYEDALKKMFSNN